MERFASLAEATSKMENRKDFQDGVMTARNEKAALAEATRTLTPP